MLKMFINSNKGYDGMKVLALIVGLSSAIFFVKAVPAYAEDAMKQSASDVREHEAKTLDLLATIDAFSEEDERLRADAAKAHYNMGNIYYQKGEYEIAVREYYQAVTLMPNDPDAHYNLAFVSDEHLRDFKTALKHYQLYLYLFPNSPDANFVKEKIVKVRLELKGKVNSPLDKEVK